MPAETDRSIAAVLTDIVGNVQQIVRAEVRLATVEVREEIVKASRGAIFMAAGGVVLILAFGALLLSAIYGLATVWPPWAAALAVALATAVAGGLVLRTGVKRISDVTLAPPRTVAALKENFRWARTRTR